MARPLIYRRCSVPLYLLSLLVLTFSVQPIYGQDESYSEDFENTRQFHLIGGPSKKGPEAQWAKCQDLVGREKLKAAIRHCKYLTRTWPEHPLAVQAQRLQGDLHFADENYQAAFDAYQELLDSFAGQFDYNAVLNQQLECARRLQNKVYKAFFGLNTYQQPLLSIPLYRQILVNAPHIQDAPEILYTIGTIYLGRQKYKEAVKDFAELEQQYPDSPFSELAALGRAQAFQKMADRTPTDIRPRELERATLQEFLATYPKSPRVEDVRLRLKDVYDQLAAALFEKGRFYEEISQKPKAALTIYKTLLEQYPDSEWTENARARILSLTTDPQSSKNPDQTL